MTAKQRTTLSLSEKVQILDKVKDCYPGSNMGFVAAKFGLPRSTMLRLLQNEEKIRSEAEKLPASRKRTRPGKNIEVEKALKEWFEVVNRRGVRLDGKIMKKKAELFARELGYPEFKATNGWFCRWKSRNEIKYKRVHGEKASADFSGAKNWKTSALPRLLEQFSPDDIYNADETGLYYRAMPDGSFTFKSENLMGSKKAMDRITVLVCANMSGNDKKKLLVIGKSAKPRCFKGMNMKSLPVDYRSNSNAWMTTSMFNKWLDEWNANLVILARKILLFVDNCSAHSRQELSNIQIEFLPPNTTCLTQPMDMGIIKNLKSLYRGALVDYTLKAIEDSLITSDTTAKDVSSKISILQAIEFLSDSWRKVKSTTITNCYKHCGFKPVVENENDVEKMEAEVNENNNSISRVHDLAEFLSIDSQLQCFDESGTDFEKQIIDDILHERPGESNDHEQEDQEPTVELISDAKAKKNLDELRLYFMKEGNEHSPKVELDVCYDYVASKLLSK